MVQLRIVACAVGVMALLCFASDYAVAANNNAYLRQQQSLLLQRTDEVKDWMRHLERKLHDIEIERNDKLEELGELTRSRAALSARRAAAADLDIEINLQKRNLFHIEEQRSDCLEQYDKLSDGLFQLNRKIAACDAELRSGGH